MHYQDFYPILLASTASLQHVRDTLIASVYPNMSDIKGNQPAKETDAKNNSTAPPGSWTEEVQGEKYETTDEVPIVAYKVPESIRKDYWTPEQLESFEIQRFRPNILVESYTSTGEKESEKGAALVPWEEDAWTHVEVFDGKGEKLEELGWGKQVIGKGTGIDCVARCARCLVPSIDPSTGYRDPHLPYLVLQKFRIVQPEFKKIGKPCFGMLSSPSQPSGVFRIGDIVRVTSTTDPFKRTMTA